MKTYEVCANKVGANYSIVLLGRVKIVLSPCSFVNDTVSYQTDSQWATREYHIGESQAVNIWASYDCVFYALKSAMTNARAHDQSAVF